MMLNDLYAPVLKALLYPCYKVTPPSSKLRLFSNIAAWAHFIQFVVVLILNETQYKHIPPDRIFVSSTIHLSTPYHMIRAYDDPPSTQCAGALDVLRSDWYQSRPHLDNGDLTIKGADGSMLLDLRRTTVVEWNDRSARLDVTAMIMCFFLLSWAFQILNGWYIETYPNGPRYLQYVEYSLSASLTIVVMALNAGIQDLYTILTIFALFFGMNVFGIVAEFMVHLAEELEERVDFSVLRIPFRYLWLIPHACGWVLFLFTWLPIIVKYTKTKACSKNAGGMMGVPWFVEAAIVFESILYIFFGIVQLVVLVCRTRYPKSILDLCGFINCTWKDILDVSTVTLSLVAKTWLAWMLLGPRLMAKTD
jgi:hypothetical protein